MPDKHEVGGSSPLGPTKEQWKRTLKKLSCFKFIWSYLKSVWILIIKVKKLQPHGGVAQLGEHLPCKQGVMGSNPIISTMEAEKASAIVH